jgi:hypothetical protein
MPHGTIRAPLGLALALVRLRRRERLASGGRGVVSDRWVVAEAGSAAATQDDRLTPG